MALSKLLAEHLADFNSGWSMGSFGAIAEFHQDAGEALIVDGPDRLTRATARGGIRIDGDMLLAVRPVAYETLSPRPHRWTQAVALCLPEETAAGKGRTRLSGLGPDTGAIRTSDREAILFDMGLGLPQCDFCIRTADDALLEVLRANEGRSLFEHDNPAMPAILRAHPHRIALTALGRTEVYQKIGGPDTGGVSPPGPHTHVLPKLLKSGRTHSANTPIPEGFMPLAYLHPGNPVIGAMGEDRPFDADLHRAFQHLLEMFGIEEAVAEKRRMLAALEDRADPAGHGLPASRIGRAAARLALRQHAHVAASANDASMLAAITRWQSIVDPNRADDDEDDDSPGH